jgi:RNA polymerase sigma factor for flagellar operon FliA
MWWGRLDDLEAEAFEALFHAARQYDPANPAGATFQTFANHRIRGSVIDYLRKQDPVGRWMREQIKAGVVNPQEVVLPKLLEGEPSRKALSRVSAATGFSPETAAQYQELRKRVLEAVALLDKKRRKVFFLLFNEALDQKQVAKIMGLHDSRICQIRAEILKHLREELEDFSA